MNVPVFEFDAVGTRAGMRVYAVRWQGRVIGEVIRAKRDAWGHPHPFLITTFRTRQKAAEDLLAEFQRTSRRKTS